jgi:hypothetical protein
VKECDYTASWYHGSPQELPVLRKGSWVTQFKELAKAFSHKPALISLGGDFVNIKHNGRVPGFLYTVAEPVGPKDVTYLRDTGQSHWQTSRDLQLQLVAKLPIDDPPQLSEEEIAELRKEIPEGTTGYIGTPDDERTAEQGAPLERQGRGGLGVK